MKKRIVKASRLFNSDRIDAWYFLSPGSLAADRVQRIIGSDGESSFLGGAGGLGSVWSPNRFKRSYAATGESSVPYLRPYDVFEYLPFPADLLSVKRTRNLSSYRLRKGMLLQSCSGRNLGPAVYVDEYLAGFALSHDMVRIEIADEETRFFVLAFLQSPIGQSLLRRDKSGSVIDHITASHISAMRVPLFSRAGRSRVAESSRSAVSCRESARSTLDSLRRKYEQSLPEIRRDRPLSKGWSVRARSAGNRLDAASFDPSVASIRRDLKKAGGLAVSAVADVVKPAG